MYYLQPMTVDSARAVVLGCAEEKGNVVIRPEEVDIVIGWVLGLQKFEGTSRWIC